MPKLNFSGNIPNTIRNNLLKLPVIPVGAFFQKFSMASKMAAKKLTQLYRRVGIPPHPPKKYNKRFITVFYPTGYIVNDSQSKCDH